MSKMGGGLPPTFDEKTLEPMIEQCLTPLPQVEIKAKKLKKDDDSKYSSKAMDKDANLNKSFADDPVKSLGVMPE